MHFSHQILGVLFIGVLLLVLVTPVSLVSSYDQTYSFQANFGLLSQNLYVSVPPSLYEYYSAKTHSLADDGEYAKLVTPDAFKPVAESIQSLTRDKSRSDEEFANAVLMLVHQVPYVIDGVKYPIETLVESSGKCDTLSLLAASIMKAGGLDVVLLYFKGVHHINVGVYLPYEPHGTWWWQSPTGYEYNGKKYWIAECTSAMEWKVGDVPPLVADEQPWIISLENSEAASPAQISSKLGSPLNSSSMSISISSDPADIRNQERAFIISGSISPGYANESVVVYFSQDGVSYGACRTETDYSGKYSLSLIFNSTGTYYVRTSWSGNSECAGADSELLTVFLGFPHSLIQFEGPDYYFTYGRYGGLYELRVRQGVEDFLDVNLSGSGVLLTGDLIIMKSGQILTVPKSGEITENIEKITIPKGFQPLRLPEDIERTTNNQFGFILQNSGGNNYTLDVKGLDDYDMARINKLGEKSIAFMNASANIREDTWYKVAAKISEDEITADLRDEKGTLLESIRVTNDDRNVTALVMLIANNTDRAVAFKDLEIETFGETNLPAGPEGDNKAANGNLLLAQYVSLAIILVAVFAAVVYFTERRQARDKIRKNVSLCKLTCIQFGD